MRKITGYIKTAYDKREFGTCKTISLLAFSMGEEYRIANNFSSLVDWENEDKCHKLECRNGKIMFLFRRVKQSLNIVTEQR
jgi:hypothetical protein